MKKNEPRYGLTPSKVDDPTLDSDGQDGVPTFISGALTFARELSNGDRVYQANFHNGSQRVDATERATKGLLSEFQDYVRANGKPCGACQRAFLGN